MRQSFLNLGSLRKKTNDAVDLGKPDYLVLRNVGYPGGSIDGDEVVFTGAGQADIAYLDHFLNPHLVVDDGNFGEIKIIETPENLVDIHFCNAMRRFGQAIVVQIQTKGPGYVGERVLDALIFLITLVLMGYQWCFQSALEQGMTHQVCFKGVG